MNTLEEEWQAVRKKVTEVDIENTGYRALFYSGALAVMSIMEPIIREKGRYEVIEKLNELTQETATFTKDYRVQR